MYQTDLIYSLMSCVQDLYDAVRSKDIEKAKQLCSLGLDVNIRLDPREWSCLNVAVDKKDYRMVRLLLENKADPNEIEYPSNIPLLTVACDYPSDDSMKVIEALLEYKADPNLRTSCDTPAAIHRVCPHLSRSRAKRNFTATVNLLLQYKASVNTSFHGSYPIHMATRSQNHSVINLLLNEKADVNELDKHGNSALYYAMSYDSIGTAAILLQRGACLTDYYSERNETIPYIQQLVYERLLKRLPSVLAKMVAKYII
jgi:ankyrin repeat protein